MRAYSTQPDIEKWKEWKTLQNMTLSQMKKFLASEDGQNFGLSESQAKKLNIASGRTSAKWIIKMNELGGKKSYQTAVNNWPPMAWSWMRRQLAFIKRKMNIGSPLFKDGKKTRHYTQLLGWGHDPLKK